MRVCPLVALAGAGRTRADSVLVRLVVLFGLFLPAVTRSQDPPRGVEPIGGRWYVRTHDEAGKPLDKPVYLYLDRGSDVGYVDLFSYSQRDSNGDGIDEVRISHEPGSELHPAGFLVIKSQGYPNHPTAIFPNSGNPNSIAVQDFTFRLPLEPRKSDTITRLPMGPVGTAINGVVFFNPFEQGGMNAVEGYSEVWLDACNGHADPNRGYHYHATPGRFPYILGGYRGVVEPSNNRGLRWAGSGGIENNAEGDSVADPAIVEIRPGAVAPGGKRQVTIELDPREGISPRGAGRQPGPMPEGAPSWVQIGPYEATAIRREGNLVTITLAIPEDATLGVLLDCHLEFEGAARGGRNRVYKCNDVLRVVE